MKQDTLYDPADRVTDVNSPQVPINGGALGVPNVHKIFDFNGNITTLQDPDGNKTINTYDALNRLKTTTDAFGIEIFYTYDSVGNRTSIKDGNTNTTSFTYDGFNRLLTTIDPAGNQTTFNYDPINKIQRIDAIGQTTSYLYDKRNRLTNTVYASSLALNSQRISSYDDIGNLLSVTEPLKPTANVAYSYDALNRPVTDTSNGELIVTATTPQEID